MILSSVTEFVEMLSSINLLLRINGLIHFLKCKYILDWSLPLLCDGALSHFTIHGLEPFYFSFFLHLNILSPIMVWIIWNFLLYEREYWLCFCEREREGGGIWTWSDYFWDRFSLSVCLGMLNCIDFIWLIKNMTNNEYKSSR